jgi:hypothetical protein
MFFKDFFMIGRRKEIKEFKSLSNRSVKPPLSSGGYKLHSQSEY